MQKQIDAEAYYRKYKGGIFHGAPAIRRFTIQEIQIELFYDALALLRMRNVKSNAEFTAVINEVNTVWNTLCNMFQVPEMLPERWKRAYIYDLEETYRG